MHVYEEHLVNQRELFVEEELKYTYSKLISFVKDAERKLHQTTEKPVFDQKLVEILIHDFAATWKSGIESINQDVLEYFANFKNGMAILKQALTQLLLYYTRFQEIIKQAWSRPPAFVKDIVSTAAILVEIKKYSRTF